VIIEAETVEPNKTLVRSVKRNLKDLGRDGLVDMIHTLVLAVSLAKTPEGRRVHVSFLLGIIDLATSAMGSEFTEGMVESANNVSVVLQEAMEKVYLERCLHCPDKDVCPDGGGGGGDPPVIH
jgi:hypothetical protein